MEAMWVLLLLLLLSPLLLRGGDALIGGDDAIPGQFPYQVLTCGQDKDPLRNFGTGVLIHPEWVLTSADSIAGYVSVMVTLGVVDRHSQDASRQDIPALNVFVHPKWPGQWKYKKSHRDDVGLVQLATPATLNAYVQIAYLPRGHWYSKGYVGRTATIAGWGMHQTNGMGYRDQERLKWERTTVMGFLKCYWHRFSVSERTGWLRPSHICADTKGTGPCSNDGGAPLVVLDDKLRPVVVGLFPTPIIDGEACDSNYPSVFIRVSAYLDWVASVANVTAP